jgi:hypothetical protein
VLNHPIWDWLDAVESLIVFLIPVVLFVYIVAKSDGPGSKDGQTIDHQRVQIKMLYAFHIFFGVQLLFAAAMILLVGLLLLSVDIIPTLYRGGSITYRLWDLLFLASLVGGILFCLLLGIRSLATARHLRSYQQHRYCTITAALQCIVVPFGTLIGIATIHVLMRPHVRERFESPAQVADK